MASSLESLPIAAAIFQQAAGGNFLVALLPWLIIVALIVLLIRRLLKLPPITRGIIILIVGIALIIISPKLLFVGQGHPSEFDPWGVGNRQITDLRNVTMLFGVALLIVGGVISAVGFGQTRSTQPTTLPPPTTQPVDTQSVSPKSVELGNTPDKVQSVMGQPDKIMNLGVRVIHVYKDMKIIYDDGKVSDVQLS